jgi:hypothetical protein
LRQALQVGGDINAQSGGDPFGNDLPRNPRGCLPDRVGKVPITARQEKPKKGRRWRPGSEKR